MKPKPNVGLSQQLNELWDSMVNFKQGLTSGLDNLDQITKGWKDGCLYVVAGRPAMGKTAVSLTFACLNFSSFCAILVSFSKFSGSISM